MNYYLYAWVASIGYGVYAVLTKLVGKYQLKNTWQFSFFSILFGSIAIVPIALLNGATIASHWTFIILASLTYTVGMSLYLIALKNLDVSVMNPMFNVRTAISVFIGYFFLKEILTVKSLWLIGLIIFAGFFATLDEKFSAKSFFNKNIAIVLLFMLSLSLQSVFVNKAIAHTNYWTATMWINLLPVGFSFISLYPHFKKDLRKSKLSDYFGVFVSSIVGGLASLAAYKAFEKGIGVSSVIISLPFGMIFVFAFSIFKPNLMEKHSLKVYALRFLATGVMFWASLQLLG